jgi:hypothetical protein
MNSEEYGSDRGVFMDGLRNTTIHDSKQPDSFSRFEPESCQVSGSGHCSTAAFVIRHATHVTRRRLRKRRVADISCTQQTFCKICTLMRQLQAPLSAVARNVNSWTALSNKWLMVHKPYRTWWCAYPYSFTYDLKYLNKGHFLKSSVLSSISSST